LQIFAALAMGLTIGLGSGIGKNMSFMIIQDDSKSVLPSEFCTWPVHLIFKIFFVI
jgi:hypothetical protein